VATRALRLGIVFDEAGHFVGIEELLAAVAFLVASALVVVEDVVEVASGFRGIGSVGSGTTSSKAFELVALLIAR
jgi:hypothetical protein